MDIKGPEGDRGSTTVSKTPSTRGGSGASRAVSTKGGFLGGRGAFTGSGGDVAAPVPDLAEDKRSTRPLRVLFTRSYQPGAAAAGVATKHSTSNNASPKCEAVWRFLELFGIESVAGGNLAGAQTNLEPTGPLVRRAVIETFRHHIAL